MGYDELKRFEIKIFLNKSNFILFNNQKLHDFKNLMKKLTIKNWIY